MQITQIKILAKEDSGPAIPEHAGKTIHDVRLDYVTIIEGGMQSGRTSVCLSINLPDGSVAAVQLSAGQFDQVAGAVRGACLRFGEDLTK
jgi:hypothetical protein